MLAFIFVGPAVTGGARAKRPATENGKGVRSTGL